VSDLADLHEELRGVTRNALVGSADDADAVVRHAGQLGWWSLEIPAELGGAGATFAETAVVLGEVGRAAAAGSFLGTAVTGVAMAGSGAGPGAERLLERIAGGEAQATVVLAPHGDAPSPSPAFEMRSGLLHGLAHDVVDAPRADTILVVATQDGEIVVVAVPAGDLSISPTPLLDRTRSVGTVEAVGVAVGSGQVWPIAGDARLELDRVFDRAATALAIDSLGIAGRMLDDTVSYVGQRRQFDRTIGSFQAVKHQLADVLVDLRIGQELVGAAIGSIVAGRDAGVAASRAKAFCCEVAVSATGTAMQLHGGIGYTWESGIHTYLKRAMLNRSLLGSPERHRDRLGERLIDGAFRS